jgi:HPt (histidine-containing phosphotransfer) domain-containing protein
MTGKSTSTEPVLDLDSALARLGYDRELFADMSNYLAEDSPKLINDLRAAIAAQNATAVRMAAHALKGLIAGCGGVRAMNVAQQLEDAGHSGDLSQANFLASTLDSELAQLRAALAPHLR